MPYSLRDFEVVIDPLIFDLRLNVLDENFDGRWREKIESDAYLFDKRVSSVFNQFEANVYYFSNFFRIFGFQNLSREQSLQRAREVQKALKLLYPPGFDVNLGFSTLGLKEHEHIHKNLLAYKYTPEFNSIMSGYIRFAGIEEYENWMAG